MNKFKFYLDQNLLEHLLLQHVQKNAFELYISKYFCRFSTPKKFKMIKVEFLFQTKNVKWIKRTEQNMILLLFFIAFELKIEDKNEEDDEEIAHLLA